MKAEPLKMRRVETAAGEVFDVPTYVVRIDSTWTHGWQVRHGEPSKFFADGAGATANATASLKRAVAELKRRMKVIGVKRRKVAQNYSYKGSNLPLGISGPIVRRRRGGTYLEAYLAVVVPVFGRKPKRAMVYIGNEATYSVGRFRAALKKALQIRAEAMAVAEADALRAGPTVARTIRASKVT